MEATSKAFLEQLITTPSPSGDEVAVQRVWMDYVKGFAHQIETDMIGNVMASVNPDNPFKIMLAGHCDEIAFMVSYIDSNGYIYVTKAGGINPKVALGMTVKVLGHEGTLKGIVGVKPQHKGGPKDKIEVSDLYIDCGANTKEEVEKFVMIGDYVIYDTNYEYLLNDKIVGRGLDNRTGAFIVAEVLRRIADKDPKVAVYAVSTVNEETNMGGAYFAASHINPTMAIACDVSFATDHPDMSPKESGEIALGKGPILSKGAPISKKINGLLEKVAKVNELPIQYELTPGSTGTDADRIRLTGKGVPVALVSLPLRYMHAPCEVASLKDIETEIELLVQMILSLDGTENLKPLE
ncbi:M20/M25/M40 family metallo-hydrolase [Niameybacter massiliensis]|uniref:M20/M25/M40 family metallo-hydrolase n=1 Tax=Holtiella tumoricola TaxID=3018743 RepID=A0AA42IZV5_9FIRM|nr:MULTISPECIES: M20/M25/M40 family metallo-hydrolase [Lachnospirales]MDA3730862.1 M20/M25/M40 family metallo-hydrolase [Holtiella tumoricola]